MFPSIIKIIAIQLVLLSINILILLIFVVVILFWFEQHGPCSRGRCDPRISLHYSAKVSDTFLDAWFPPHTGCYEDKEIPW
jgi:hypothetical protein